MLTLQQRSVTTDLASLFQRQRAVLKLEDVGENYDLVSFGPVGSGHFSEALWLPNQDKIFSFDTWPPAHHYELVTAFVQPFVEYCLKEDDDTQAVIEVVRKDDSHSSCIERQDMDSNVCAFTATSFLSSAISNLMTLYIAEDPADDIALFTLSLQRQEKLAGFLDNVASLASKYERRRRLAMRYITDLCKLYQQHRAQSSCAQSSRLLEVDGSEEEYVFDNDNDYVEIDDRSSMQPSPSHSRSPSPILNLPCYSPSGTPSQSSSRSHSQTD
jgi:hypothetical protein